MSKIIIVNREKPDFTAHQTLNCEVDFSVIQKTPDYFQIITNTDKGAVHIDLNRKEMELLLNRIKEKL
ncbi:MAG: hypothetical protein DI622_16645 [Chryseobacterium sp.]|nr:MAG: hypothetical protein DI622_16645 [Chryseobacterium sp.]